MQADSEFRNQIEDVPQLRVRSHHGEMVPIGTMATVKKVAAPLVLTRYNMYPAAAINGNVAKGSARVRRFSLSRGFRPANWLPMWDTNGRS